MWTNYSSFRPGNSFFSNAPTAEAFANPFGGGAPSFGVPFGNDLFGMGGNASVPMAQMLPMMMAAIIQQQLALMFLAELMAMGGGGRNGQGGGQSNGRFPNGGWNGGRRLPPGTWNRGGVPGSSGGPAPGRTGGGTTGDFVQQALSQDGKPYVYGAEANANNANPRALDCSELVEWAAARSGGYMPDGSSAQLAHVRRNGTEMSVEQALRTPGALLFRPGHVAISLGDGRTIEAKGRNYGVGVFNGRGRFTAAGMIPGMQAGAATGASSTALANNNNGAVNTTGATSATGQSLNRQLGGVFAGQGQAFVDAGQRNGVDPNLLAAIAMHETGNGTSNAVRNYNNPGGLMNPRTNWSTLQRFDSLGTGLDRMASNLKRNYIDKGLTDIGSIGRKYAPVGAANDPRGLNGHWVNNVARLYQRLA